MEKEQINEIKKIASEVLGEMIDKMYSETDVNDDSLTVNIAAHDIKGDELSLNQFSAEINVGENIIVTYPRFIRYPQYFGRANKILLKQLSDKHMEEMKNLVKLDAVERAEADTLIWDQLRALEDGIRSLESTGFLPDNIERFVTAIREGRDPYAPPEPEEVPPEEQDREFVNPEVITGNVNDEIREAVRRRLRDIREHQEATVENRAPVRGYTREELENLDTIHPPQTDLERAQVMIREYLRGTNLDVDYIDPAHRQELLSMAEFEEIPRTMMISAINEFNGEQDNIRGEIPSTDEIIRAAQEMDRDDRNIQNNHDRAAIIFIERWFEDTIENIGLIDQRTYDNMITNVETTEPPGVYLFALDRVIGAHNASITAGRQGEVDITSNTFLEGSPQRISTLDAAYRLFAHVTGVNNPDVGPLGRYVDDAMLIQLRESANRNNIPLVDVDHVVHLYNTLHRTQPLDNWEEEEARKTDIFILSYYNDDVLIEDENREQLMIRGELIGIDPTILDLSIYDHNREAERRQTIEGARNEANEINREDLQAAADRYDQLTHSPLSRDTIPPTTEERMQRNVRLDPNDPTPLEVTEHRENIDRLAGEFDPDTERF